jgi:hypothetical protein
MAWSGVEQYEHDRPASVWRAPDLAEGGRFANGHLARRRVAKGRPLLAGFCFQLLDHCRGLLQSAMAGQPARTFRQAQAQQPDEQC